MNISGVNIETLDLIAPIWFFGLWFLYAVFADSSSKKSLVNVMHRYRIRWMKLMIRRDDRLIDERILQNLVSSTTFLASTSILIIGGLVAVLGYGEKATHIINSLSVLPQTTIHMWAIKTMFLLMIFVYSFFKFTWVIRQFNYASILIIAAPLYKDGEEGRAVIKKAAKYSYNSARLVSNAGRHFNLGVRSYYFGLVALSWYISPILLMVLSVLVILVLYRREFISQTLTMLE